MYICRPVVLALCLFSLQFGACLQHIILLHKKNNILLELQRATKCAEITHGVIKPLFTQLSCEALLLSHMDKYPSANNVMQINFSPSAN